MALTGRFDFRKTLSGHLMLLLEEDVDVLWSPLGKRTRRRWRRAAVMDLAAPELRPLIDLRTKPNYAARTRPFEGPLLSDELKTAVGSALIAASETDGSRASAG
jgi:hypothetical protein